MGNWTETKEWTAKLEMRDQHTRHQIKYSQTSPKQRVIIYFRNNKYKCPPLGRTNVAYNDEDVTGSDCTVMYNLINIHTENVSSIQ